MFNNNTKFLVVDDFATMRKIVKRILDELGYRNVVEASDGKEALSALNEWRTKNDPVGFVISDWNMPNMMGIELLKHCRGHEDFKSLPFMLVTAESEKEQIANLEQIGYALILTTMKTDPAGGES